MAKVNIAEGWKNIKKQIIKPDVRRKAFLFISANVFAFALLAATIINFLTGEKTLGYITLGYTIGLFVTEVTEFICFSKFKKCVEWPFIALTVIFSVSITGLYLFLAPFDSLYIFWICVIPIMYFLCFGVKRGIIGATSLFIFILLTFYWPYFSSHTQSTGSIDNQTTKAFFIVYYFSCCFVGMILSFMNELIIKRLDVVKDTYYQDANTDIVTGLRNQAYFLSYVKKLQSVVKPGESVGLMFIDIDDFKIYNDKYGHIVGNEVLVEVANRLNQVPHALLVRWGGDEFAIVERNLSKDEFVAKANFLLKSVEGIHNGVTISIGLAYYIIEEDFDFDEIFNEADMQAIRAKGKGKNCIVINN